MRICSLLLLLNCILTPQKVSTSFRPTIINGKDDTILFADSDETASDILSNVYSGYRDLHLETVPKLIFFGTPTRLLGVYRVYFEEVVYNLPSVRRAVDVYIRLCTVLAIKHSKISKLVWIFVARYVYGLVVKERYATVEKFEEYLKATSASSLKA